MRNIGLIGKARSGKDTVARRLCEVHGYQRVAFADPLKAMALNVDPWVGAGEKGLAMCRRLSELVEYWGWETCKDSYPEVRRILQQMGQSVREADADFWVRVALAKIDALRGLPVVVSDVRYPNEAEALRAAGFMLVRIKRPGAPDMGIAAAHGSETALDGFAAGAKIINNGSVDHLRRAVDLLATL